MSAGGPGGWAYGAAEDLLALVFPSWCPACGRFVSRPRAGPLCAACWEAVPLAAPARCGCGAPLPGASPRCPRCRRGANPVRLGASLGRYDGPLRAAIHELKFRGRRRVAGRLAALCLRAPWLRPVLSGAALVVPVPLHPRREGRRGFNQAALIARAVARGAGLPFGRGLLVRRTDTPPQTGLGARARRRNVAGAFAVRRPGALVGRTVLLVDDVVTTGATARSCARALREAGAAEVRVLSMARVD